MKYVIAMDSFKGCLDADKVCEAAAEGVLSVPGNEVTLIPLADGGEGTAFAICNAVGGKIIRCTVTDPYGNDTEGYFGALPDGRHAVIDTAAASGLGLSLAGGGSIGTRSTYGTGKQIADLLDMGYTKITVGLGGSGTNDGGTGALAALGAVFYNNDGNVITFPTGDSLARIARIDASGLDPRLKGAELSMMFDVDIPLTGEHGTTYNYSAQKGASPDDKEALENGMKNYERCLFESLGIKASEVPGAGAAGGLGIGLFTAGFKPVNGALHMLETVNFEDAVRGADIVITGEGKTDFQTADGKLPVAVAAISKKHGVPVVCVCGCAAPVNSLYESGIDAIFAIPSGPMTLETSIANAYGLIKNTCRNIAGLASSLK